MSKTLKILKWSFISLAGIIFIIVMLGVWFMSLLPEPKITRELMERTTVQDLPYLTENSISPRGKILAVVTSTDSMGQSGKSTGYELTELARAYYVFEANGYEVDIASPLGGNPPVVLDKGDMKEFDYAFLNDTFAQQKVNNSIPINDIDPIAYDAIYFVGGKGAMFDFPNNKAIQSIVSSYYEQGKVIAAVCHGPAALVNVPLSNGEMLLANKKVSGFTNEEELLLIPDAKDIFPFLLQDKLSSNGAEFQEGFIYLNNVVVDRNLVTGQNPWSVWTLAESVIKQLGHTPKPRLVTAEENSVFILSIYNAKGLTEAKEAVAKMVGDQRDIDAEVLAVHSLLAAYQLKLRKSYHLIKLLRFSNTFR